MYIKIERGDKTHVLESKEYFVNKTQEGSDLNIVGIDNEVSDIFVDKDTSVFVMNDNGKTIDRI